MKVITVHHPHSFVPEDFPPLSMALGYFDGVHRGHQKVIKTAIKEAGESGLSTAVMTFDPHPSVVLGRKHKHVHYITPLQDKIKLMEELGVEYLFIVRFTSDFANLHPQEYVDQYIINLNVRHVSAGFDFSYGKLGKGNMETLQFHSRDKFSYTTVNKQTDHEEKISSTLIRKSLAEGEAEKVEHLLGRYYSTSGTVIHGDKRGRKIGFPTANIELSDDYIIPKLGVYAVRIFVQNHWHNGVANLGYKPTFNNPDDKVLSIEVHIFDYNSSIYGEEVKVEWHKYIRSEQKFNGIQQLIAQIEKDKQEAVSYFEKLLV
ncbi:bifunctional riboflavin kinase/FAD synthetase [Rossellomorea vietnamensis]|uniref:Riboflavin biosynthesis protein n=1 Tax=Rossellomorea aquimaris TaxID=189382 RepID=A0A5D4U521_9BACI|nr:bifunctional riboflavin kinase/FAD synthetase [Rossellomorea aquimaris]TYS82425.1 bifunctional riboflavin kinase/FAD synthetase [Rossellomorea aquimaris]